MRTPVSAEPLSRYRLFYCLPHSLPSQSPETTTDLLPVTMDLSVLELLIHGIKQYVLSLCLVYVTGKMSVRLIYATPSCGLAVSLGFLLSGPWETVELMGPRSLSVDPRDWLRKEESGSHGFRTTSEPPDSGPVLSFYTPMLWVKFCLGMKR